jgi:hypothetical protein
VEGGKGRLFELGALSTSQWPEIMKIPRIHDARHTNTDTRWCSNSSLGKICIDLVEEEYSDFYLLQHSMLTLATQVEKFGLRLLDVFRMFSL